MIFFIFINFSIFSQTNVCVDIDDEVYSILNIAEVQGLCTPLLNVKPYTQKYILKKIEEIKNNIYKSEYQTNIMSSEVEYIENYIKKFENKLGFDFQKFSYRIQNQNQKFPLSFEFNDEINILGSVGLYQTPSQNAFAYDIYNNFNFTGDITKYFSYRATLFAGLTYLPLQDLGSYNIGRWWYSPLIPETSDVGSANQNRTVNVKRYNSYLPFSYNKFWDGSCHYLTNISAAGFRCWPETNSLAFGMSTDLRFSVLNDVVEFGVSRMNREWAGMDEGSSLVLNKKARPFVSADLRVTLFDSFSISGLTGILEAPNRMDLNSNAWYSFDNSTGNIDFVSIMKNTTDAYFFQNAFSIAMVDLDFKYVHIDFGTSCVWPKRLEFGYAVPTLDRLIYQNNIGDYDNIALFGDIKFRYPGLGSLWFSLFMDEISVSKEMFEKTRCMFAFQIGSKLNVPILPFTTISFRYTKIEPYCYTHLAIPQAPWYNSYIAESYTNNGESLGYYLPPNSDELLFKIESKPIVNSSFGFQYQLIRHGTDWGSGSVPGSNIYSELTPDREHLRKYFLRDGVYEWMSIFSLSGSYNFKSFDVPVSVFLNAGYIYQWFTGIDGVPCSSLPYHKINTPEYAEKNGFVFTIGIKLFNY